TGWCRAAAMVSPPPLCLRALAPCRANAPIRSPGTWLLHCGRAGIHSDLRRPPPERSREDEMTRSIAWDKVTHADVVRAVNEYDRLGPEEFFSAHGFAPTTTYDLHWERRRYPPKAILGTAYEL